MDKVWRFGPHVIPIDVSGVWRTFMNLELLIRYTT